MIRSCPWTRARLGRLAALLGGLSLVATPTRALAAPAATERAAEGAEPGTPATPEDPGTPVRPLAPDDDPVSTHRDLSGTGRGSAFSVPVADRLDPYGPRPPGVPALSRDQIIRYALQNPLVQAAEEKVEAMKSQARKAQFAWLPIIDTVACER